MMRVLRIYRYFFGWQPTLGVTTVIGLVLLALGAAIYPEPITMLPIMLGLILSLLFPVVFSCVAYRQLITNPRLALVPKIRPAATAALFLMALTAGIASWALLSLGNKFETEMPAAAIALISVLVFSLVSLYLLVTQWLLTKQYGLFLYFLVPLLLARLGTAEPLGGTLELIGIALIAALALAGWSWLWLAANRPGLPKGSWLAVNGTETVASSLRRDQARARLTISFGQNSFNPAGTLLRGTPDSWPQRLWMTSVMLLGLPLAVYCVMILFSLVTGFALNNIRIIGPDFLLLWSFISFLGQSSIRSLEWPARLRLLWLRAPGDRQASWRTMENSLLADVTVCACLSGAIALILLAFTDTPAMHLLLYAGGCVGMSLVTSYSGFWARADRLPRILHTLSITILLIIAMSGVVIAGNSTNPASALWLLVVAALLTLVLRFFARRSVLKLDWCAVRPLRLSRPQAGKPG